MFESERDERLVLSTRHIKLRTVLFVLAFLTDIVYDNHRDIMDRRKRMAAAEDDIYL